MLPRGLARKEYAHRGLTELHLVGSMHERKALMASLADGFVALPGGLGTLEEMLEILTWAQLGIHQKPVGVVDVDGYWAGLLALLRHAVQEGFVRPEYATLLLVETDARRAPGPLRRVAAAGHAARLARRHRDLTPREPALGDRPRRGALLVLLCAVWGVGQVAVKVGNEGVSPLCHAAFRSAGAALLLWGWSAWRGISLIRRDGTAAYGMTIATLFAIEFVCIYWGFMFTTASRGVLFVYAAPFFVALGAHWLFPSERLPAPSWPGWWRPSRASRSRWPTVSGCPRTARCWETSSSSRAPPSGPRRRSSSRRAARPPRRTARSSTSSRARPSSSPRSRSRAARPA